MGEKNHSKSVTSRGRHGDAAVPASMFAAEGLGGAADP